MYLALFDQEHRRIFFGERGVKSPAGHKWGGSIEYAGLRPDPLQPPFHLLLRLRLDDPLVPIELPHPVDWLPLLCGIRYGACDLGYQVISDTEVKVLTVSEKPWDGFPYENYPELLPVEHVSICDYQFDLSDPGNAMCYGGIFGLDHLSQSQFKTVERIVVEQGIYDPDLDEETVCEFVRNIDFPFVQGTPIEDCPNPKCSNHGRSASLRTFAIFHESEEWLRTLWGPHCGDLQIIYQICPVCQAIRTTNQCT